MKTLGKYSLLLLFLLLSVTVTAQLTRDLHRLFNPAYFEKESLDTASFDPWQVMISNKPKYSVEVGTSYSTFGGGLSSSYFSPTVSFMATKKLQITAGGKFSTTSLGSVPFLTKDFGPNEAQQTAGNPTEAFAYGQYKLNDKISFYGMGAFGRNQLYISPFQNGVSTADYSHLSFGMDYKVSEKFSIGASFGVSNGPAWGITPFNSLSNRRINPFFP